MPPASSRDICEHTSILQVTGTCQRVIPDAVVACNVELHGMARVFQTLSFATFEYVTHYV
jgi:hypothetical protein